MEDDTQTKTTANGYRVFTDIHIEQFKLVRLAFRIPVLQNGLQSDNILIPIFIMVALVPDDEE